MKMEWLKLFGVYEIGMISGIIIMCFLQVADRSEEKHNKKITNDIISKHSDK